jgi:hypothetical protein
MHATHHTRFLGRRRLLLSGAVVVLGGTACATREPLVPIQSTAMLPVGAVDAHHLDNRDIETRQVVSGTTAPGPWMLSQTTQIEMNPGLQERFKSMMASLAPRFHVGFEAQLLRKLRAAGVNFTLLNDMPAAVAARVGRNGVSHLAGSHDAVLDIILDAAGFRPLLREQVLTPEAYVAMDLVSAKTKKSIDGARYSFDRRNIVDDPRHLRCEANQTYKTTAELLADLPGAVKVLEVGFARLADVVANDVVQLTRGQALE